jgi:hypothetical protein
VDNVGQVLLAAVFGGVVTAKHRITIIQLDSSNLRSTIRVLGRQGGTLREQPPP